jgi:Branched-chain amino acid ATP-binding cassette transporter
MIALDLGRVVVEGPPQEVVAHPEVVAAYLGTDAAAIARSDAPSPLAPLAAPGAPLVPGPQGEE